MDNTEKIQMTINIGGCQLPVTVPFSQQDSVRDVEAQVAQLYTSWRHKFSKRTDREILAMVAYQYANFYMELSRRYDMAQDKVARCLAFLDSLDKPDHDSVS